MKQSGIYVGRLNASPPLQKRRFHMVRAKGHTAPKEILSAAEKQSLQEEKRGLQDALKEEGQFCIGTAAEQMDKDVIKRQIARIDQAIADREPPRVRGADKDALVKEAEAIENELREGIPTREEMDHPAKYPGAVRKHMNWSGKNQEKIERYRYIQRIINPEDPRSVENLRRDK
jgi:hypothetical protein